jgi:putative endonuclease
MASSFQKGRAGESRAAAILINQGCRLLQSNFRAAGAEIDLIVRDHGLVCFVEVKTWRHFDRFDLARSLGPAKQRQIIKAARHWILGHDPQGIGQYRFDVLFIHAVNADYQWYKAAFDASE